jgi:hypothetical protein
MIEPREACLDEITWLQFEQLLGMLMRTRWSDTRVTQPGNDKGVDAVSYDNVGKVVAVGQAKHTDSVGHPLMNQLLGAAVSHDAGHAVLVTTGKITKQASDDFDAHRAEGSPEAHYRGVTLAVWERGDLVRWLDSLSTAAWEQFRWEVMGRRAGDRFQIPDPVSPLPSVDERLRDALAALARNARRWHDQPSSRARQALTKLRGRYGATRLLAEAEQALYDYEAVQGRRNTKERRAHWERLLAALERMSLKP